MGRDMSSADCGLRLPTLSGPSPKIPYKTIGPSYGPESEILQSYTICKNHTPPRMWGMWQSEVDWGLRSLTEAGGARGGPRSLKKRVYVPAPPKVSLQGSDGLY